MNDVKSKYKMVKFYHLEVPKTDDKRKKEIRRLLQ